MQFYSKLSIVLKVRQQQTCRLYVYIFHNFSACISYVCVFQWSWHSYLYIFWGGECLMLVIVYCSCCWKPRIKETLHWRQLKSSKSRRVDYMYIFS